LAQPLSAVEIARTSSIKRIADMLPYIVRSCIAVFLLSPQHTLALYEPFGVIALFRKKLQLKFELEAARVASRDAQGA
jgi:hypothetical protein